MNSRAVSGAAQARHVRYQTKLQAARCRRAAPLWVAMVQGIRARAGGASHTTKQENAAEAILQGQNRIEHLLERLLHGVERQQSIQALKDQLS